MGNCTSSKEPTSKPSLSPASAAPKIQPVAPSAQQEKDTRCVEDEKPSISQQATTTVTREDGGSTTAHPVTNKVEVVEAVAVVPQEAEEEEEEEEEEEQEQQQKEPELVTMTTSPPAGTPPPDLEERRITTVDDSVTPSPSQHELEQEQQQVEQGGDYPPPLTATPTLSSNSGNSEHDGTTQQSKVPVHPHPAGAAASPSELLSENSLCRADPLYQACTRGDIATVKAILAERAAMDATTALALSSSFSFRKGFGSLLLTMQKPKSKSVDCGDFTSSAQQTKNENEEGAEEERASFLYSSSSSSRLAAGGVGGDGHTPLHAAAASGDPDVVQALVDSTFFDINATTTETNMTPLYCACFMNDLETVKLLVAAGADVNVADADGDTLLHVVSHFGYLELAQLLISRGKYSALEAENKDGKTALFVACENNHADLAHFLIAAGCDAANNKAIQEKHRSFLKENGLLQD